MSWVCYVLRCADETLYCGITNDLDKRLAAHNAGDGAKYTRGRAPVSLVYCESCADKSTALKREMQIKALPRIKKLALIEIRSAPTSES
jgi:putative endonuclease